MAPDIILHADRLILREITPADLPYLHRIFGDAECMRYYPGIKSYDKPRAGFSVSPSTAIAATVSASGR